MEFFIPLMKERFFSILFFSLFFGILVWISVNLGSEFQAVIEVPCAIENLPDDIAVSDALPSSLKIKVKGNGWAILQASVMPNLEFLLDFAHITAKDTLFFGTAIHERINFPGNLVVVSSAPESILIRVDQKISKTVPIIPIVHSQFRQGFDIVGPVKSIPEKVTLYGSRSLLSSIHNWSTKSITLFDVFAPTSVGVQLSDSMQLEIEKNVATATIEFDVQTIAERTFKNIPISVNLVPSNREVFIIPNSITIIVRSGVYTISQISEKNFSAYIDYKDILLDTSGYIVPTFILPEHVKIVQMQPEHLQYVIRK